MIIEFPNDHKVNLKAIEREIKEASNGKAKDIELEIIQEPHTVTLENDEVEYHGFKIRVHGKGFTQEDLHNVALLHDPAKSTQEEKEDEKKEREPITRSEFNEFVRLIEARIGKLGSE